MELRQLKTFQAVGKLLSFNRAAHSLNYAQSTVSVQIRSLEEELGVPLFDRLGKRVVLTEAGQALMRYSQKMIDIERETLSEVTGCTQTQGSLSLRIPQSLSMAWLPGILSKFRRHYPTVNFDINSCAYHSLVHELKSGITDLAFLLTDTINARDLECEVLGVAKLVIVAAPGHPLADRHSLDVHDLKEEAVILPKADCGYRMVFEQILLEEKVTPASIIEMNCVEAVKRCVTHGVGLTILPQMSVAREIDTQKLVVLPWGNTPMETGILMIWHKDKWISPVLQGFMDTVRSVTFGK